MHLKKIGFFYREKLVKDLTPEDIAKILMDASVQEHFERIVKGEVCHLEFSQ